jgi:mono/diheme cytochrome c family protein
LEIIDVMVRRILTLSLSLILAVVLYSGTMLSAQKTSSTSDGVYTADQSQRGTPVYQKTCAACHSDDLAGNGQAPPLTGDGFIGNWQGQSLGDLFDKTQTSMPADNPGSLTRAQNADILAFILSANKFPAGKTELPTDADALKHIHIDKPPAAPAKN